MSNRNHKFQGYRLRILFGCALILLATHQVDAQRPYEGPTLIHGDMPPGLAAESCRLANPEALTFYSQPVRLIVPDGARLEVGAQGAFVATDASQVTLGMSIGPVYRFKITRIPQHFGRELYPSIEILDKLNPPAGLESQFPIQVVISQDDLEQAIEGRMVTKVIYLENPELAMPQRHFEDSQPYFDVGGGEDPLRAAERLGRPMAIMRIGSRIPTYAEGDQAFGFHGPSPVMIAQPEPKDRQQNWDLIEDSLPSQTPGGNRIPASGEVLGNGDSLPPIPQHKGNSSTMIQEELRPDAGPALQQVPAPYRPPRVPSEIQQTQAGSGGR